MDDDLRELERLAAHGDPGALERLERARRRAGVLRTPIVLPPLGEAITEVQVTEWSVGVGDLVKRDQVVALLDTDKVSVELVAPDDGVVAEITVPGGEIAQIGAPVAELVASTPADPEVEARHDALHAAIVAAPEDAGARLAYADFLVETAARGKGVRPWGRETTRLRGEAIQRHHRAGTSPLHPRGGFERVWRTALDLVPFEVKGPKVEGGFLVGVAAPATWLRERWDRLVAHAPVTRLELLDLDVPTESALREFLAAVPASVREIAVRARVAGRFVTEESLRELLGPRHVPAPRS